VILGVEVREDAILTVVTDDRGVITARGKREGSNPVSAADAVREAVSGTALTAIGIAVRDPLEEHISSIIAAAAGAAGMPGRARIVTRGCAVALGEYWVGVAQGISYVASLTAADCVHAGLIIDGRPFEGAHGVAGVASWMALNPVEREDYRRFGCLEAEIGAAGIVRRLVWRIKSGDESRVLGMAGGDIAAITLQQIFDAARAGDGVSISVVRDTARYIGMAVANLVVITDPNTVILGGLIADAADQLLQPSRAEALRRVPRTISGSLTVTAATLGEDGGALGAARAAMLAQ
jgi:predicted NBD/HSP70 family sugar kinase